MRSFNKRHHVQSTTSPQNFMSNSLFEMNYNLTDFNIKISGIHPLMKKRSLSQKTHSSLILDVGHTINTSQKCCSVTDYTQICLAGAKEQQNCDE